MQFVSRDAGRYYIHQVDRDYALSRIEDGDSDDRDAEVPPLTRFALKHRAADWFKLSRKPREAWKTLGDLAAQLSEFELRCEGGDYYTAAAVLGEIDYDYLNLWGHYRLLIDLHEHLQGKIDDPEIALISAGNLGNAYYRIGQIQRAISLYEQALHLARGQNDRWSEGAWLIGIANCVGDLGQNTRAIEYLEQALGISRELRDRKSESVQLGNLGIRYAEIGQNSQAMEYYERALLIDREIESSEGEARNLVNMGSCFKDLGRTDVALRYYRDGLSVARRLGYRLFEAQAHLNIGQLNLSNENWSDSAREFERAIEIANDIGYPQNSREANEGLALVNVYGKNLNAAREMLEAARKFDVPLGNHRTSAVLGVVALLQRDLDSARAAFAAAINEADQLIALTPERYDALDFKGLSLCGLALCGDPAQIPTAKAAYHAARAVTRDAGIVRAVLQYFDALVQADTDGILAEVRPFAAGAIGLAQTPQQ
jgi:tetratricopeptide (TPR) repeat protein